MNRALNVANLVLFLLGALTIVFVLNVFARRENLRERIDATKTRAYSLTDQTRQLLSGLEGQWKIAIIMDQRRADRAMRRQIDEVLGRYTSASPNISVVRIDPGDPATLVEYDALLAELNAIYRDEVAAYDRALDSGLQQFRELPLFALQQSGQIEALVGVMPQDDPMREQLRQRLGAVSILSDQGDQVIAAVDKARRVDESRPVPDYDAARSTLAAALSQSAGDLDELAETLGRFSQQPGVTGQAKEFVLAAQRESRAMSQRLAEAADPLKRLAPLELSTIGTQLQQGEAAVILSPKRAAVIPSSQLFPKSNLRQLEDGRTLFDQRFRGEQLISAAIRSMTVERMPLVVFVHAEEKSLLRPRDKQEDVFGVAEMLKASRYEVLEWMLAENAAKPGAPKGQPVVWVIVPPPPARSMQPTPAVMALIDAISKHVADGESVLLSVSPSLVAKYGQPDPFATMAAGFGIEANTAELVLESETPGGLQISFGQALREFSPEHPIGRAIDGQQTYFGMPVPLRLSETSGARQFIIASIAPSPTRWIEREWTGDLTRRDPKARQPLAELVPLLVAAERSNPTGRGTQRLIMSGSGGWMISNIADVVIDIGGGRVALINPGNHELMLASVAWLAGMDDLIAASPISQEIARLRGITPAVRTVWMWIAVAGLPGACALLGLGVWWRRRR